jgi:hypothetical protein
MDRQLSVKRHLIESQMDFYPPNRNSVRAYRWRTIGRIFAKWSRFFRLWSLLAAMTLQLSLSDYTRGDGRMASGSP